MKLKSKYKSILYLFLILACLFTIVLIPGFFIKQTPEQNQNNIDANTERANTVTAKDIFLNNFVVALLAFVPIDGILFISVVLWNTGLIIASYNQPFWALTNPIVWIELGVYSFMILRGFDIIQLIKKRKTVKIKYPLLKLIWQTICIAGLVLMFGAILEFVLLNRTVSI